MYPDWAKFVVNFALTFFINNCDYYIDFIDFISNLGINLKNFKMR